MQMLASLNSAVCLFRRVTRESHTNYILPIVARLVQQTLTCVLSEPQSVRNDDGKKYQKCTIQRHLIGINCICFKCHGMKINKILFKRTTSLHAC